MSFELLEKDALLKIAEELAVDVNPSWTPAEFAKEFDEVGVEWDLVKSSVPSVAKALAKAEKEAKKNEDQAKAEEPQILIRMDRKNASYEVRGHRFTQENPFGVLAESDALYVIRNIEGFRRADPEEAADFYG
jgi:hypothetical protein